MSKIKPEATLPVPTAGDWVARTYANSEAEIAQMKEHGMLPGRLLTNEGQMSILAVADGEVTRRVALVDCHTHYKRGEGYRADCAERDANAFLMAAAKDLRDALQALHDSTAEYIKINNLSGHDNHVMRQARAALVKAAGPVS